MRRVAPGTLPIVAIDRASPLPLYRQIYEGYREAIVSGRLRAGQRLPSTRALADELGISRLPVLNAFEQLLAEGYCEGRTGAGTFVATLLTEHLGRVERSEESAADTVLPGARQVARGPVAALRRSAVWLRHPGAFAIGEVETAHFPFRVWQRLLARPWRDFGVAMTRYGDAQGQNALREAIAGYLRTSRGLRCEAGQILVVSGSQQALDLAARVLLDRGAPVWMEEPGYWGAANVLRLAECDLVPVPVDSEGLDVAAGAARRPDARAVYVTPSHQFPLGATMSASRRLQLLEWARGAGAWILEDDFDSEYRYESAPIAALQGLDCDRRVVYIGTFSKVLFPALRTGYLVVPDDLVDRFAAARAAMDIGPPSALQAALTGFISEGHFARHLQRTREIYRGRRGTLAEALETELGGGHEVLGAQAGMHLAVTIAGLDDDLEISDRAAAESLSAMPLSSLYLGEPRRRGFALGYGGCDEERIRDGVRHLARLLGWRGAGS